MRKVTIVVSVLALLGVQAAVARETTDCDLSSLLLETPDGPLSIAQRMQQLDIKGVSLAVVEDFALSCTLALGVKSAATKEPVRPDTLFQVASMSKPVTAVAVLRLVEEGALALDAPIEDQLTEWTIPAAPGLDGAKAAVTLRQILNHTAGLSTESFPGYKVGEALPTTVQILDGVPPANSEPVRIITVPGENYAYSGGGYTVLELLIEQVTGMAFADYVGKAVFTPLEIFKASFEQPISKGTEPLIAMGYADVLHPEEGGYHVYPELAAAGLWSDAVELSKFVIGLQLSLNADDRDGGLLSQAMAKEMMTPFDGTMSGLGIVRDEMYFTHGGHNRGYMSRFLSHDTDGYGLVILTNAEQPRFIGEVINAVGKAHGWEDF